MPLRLSTPSPDRILGCRTRGIYVDVYTQYIYIYIYIYCVYLRSPLFFAKARAARQPRGGPTDCS